ERRRRRAVQAQLVLLVAVGHSRTALDDEGRELVGAAGLGDLREDDEDVGEPAVRDPHLLAAEQKASVRLADRPGLRAERVGSGAGLAERIGAEGLARDESRDVLLLLLGRPEADEGRDRQP